MKQVMAIVVQIDPKVGEREKRARSIYANVLDYLNKHTLAMIGCYVTMTLENHRAVISALERYKTQWIAELGADTFAWVPITVTMNDADFDAAVSDSLTRIVRRNIQLMSEKVELFNKKNPGWTTDSRKTVWFHNFLSRMFYWESCVGGTHEIFSKLHDIESAIVRGDESALPELITNLVI